MANSVGVETRVGSSSSLLTSAVAAEAKSFSQSPAASSLVLSAIPTKNDVFPSLSSTSTAFQSISAELDGHLKACPFPTATITSGTTSKGYFTTTTLFTSLFPKWETFQRPRITTSTTKTALQASATAALPSSSLSRRASSTSSSDAVVACRHYDEKNCQFQSHSRHSHHHHHRRHHQRLNSLTFHMTVVLIFATTFASLPGMVGSTTSGQDEEEGLYCMKGVSGSSYGATIPRGDIFIEEGDTLQVYCKLNLTATRGYNASFIEFSPSKAHIPADQMEKRVINASTALLKVKNMNASEIFLSCLLDYRNGSSVHICFNTIHVGYPPLPVENFRCVSKEWKSLNCTWKNPKNPVLTKYTIAQPYPGSEDLVCPTDTAKSESCVWRKNTWPPYRPNQDPINIRINGTNPLKPGGKLWLHRFTLGEIVIPEKPDAIRWEKLPGNQYMLNWTFLNYEYFKAGLDHHLTVCYDNDGREQCVEKFYQTKPVNSMMTPYLVKDITSFLPYAYTNYSITVRLRSPEAIEPEEFWSEAYNVTIVTDSRAPDYPPETHISSFESTGKDDRRVVQIFWKSIPRLLQNGPGFKYDIQVYENESKVSIDQLETTNAYASFKRLKPNSSYRFTISAHNELGRTANASEIIVPSFDKLPGQPQSVSKYVYRNGTFDITWNRPGRYSGIVSYTVFHCASNRQRPYPCEGPLEWDKVEATDAETLHKFYNYSRDTNTQFAVSANADGFSSGMVWATCTLLDDTVPEKLRSVRAEDPTENEILIKWTMGCAYRPGDIESFKITYCQVEHSQAEKCKDDEKSQAVEGANKTMYRLKNLKPNAYYMIYVQILATAGPSEKSDVLYAKTLEGAPGPVTVFNVSLVTNVSAVLGIQSPKDWNGKLREFKIYYNASSYEDQLGEQEQLYGPGDAFNEITSQGNWFQLVPLKKLISNTNYSVAVVVCTSKCSNRSRSFSFRTKFGYTDLNKISPTIEWNDGEMSLQWSKPRHLGGPITKFEIMLKKNGEQLTDDDDFPRVNFREAEASTGSGSFRYTVPQTCEPSTNFSVQIRAVTELEGDSLVGAWSQPGNYRCGGTTSWLVWVILVVVALVAITLFGYLSFRGYHYLRRIKEGLSIKLPPGLNSEVIKLNGFTHKPPPRSRSCENDKELCAYPLQPTSTQRDESNDFLSSDMNQGESSSVLRPVPLYVQLNAQNQSESGGASLPSPQSAEHAGGAFENHFVVLDEEPDQHAEESLIEDRFCPSATTGLLDGFDFSTITTADICGDSALENDGNDIKLTDFSTIHPDRCSSPSSTYKKLGIHSNGSAVLIEPLPGPSSRSTPSVHSEVSGGELSLSSPSHSMVAHTAPMLPTPIPTTSQPPASLPTLNGPSSVGVSRTKAPDVLSSSPSSPNKSLNAPQPTPVLVPTSISSSVSPATAAVPSQTQAPLQHLPTSNNVARSPPVAAVAPLPVASPPPPVAAAPPSSSYVKWTTLVPDMKTGDAGGVLENGSRQPPYCQVGMILLDS